MTRLTLLCNADRLHALSPVILGLDPRIHGTGLQKGGYRVPADDGMDPRVKPEDDDRGVATRTAAWRGSP